MASLRDWSDPHTVDCSAGSRDSSHGNRVGVVMVMTAHYDWAQARSQSMDPEDQVAGSVA